MLKLWLALAPVALLCTTALADARVGGSYQRTCFGIRQNGPILSARYRRPDGSVNFTSIDLRRCSTGVANTYGRLTCGGVRRRF